MNHHARPARPARPARRARPAHTLRALAAPALLAALALLGAPAAHAQTDSARTLRGTVTAADGGGPLDGANVFLLETLEGSLTDGEGRFAIRTRHRGAATLVVRRIGYRELRLPLTIPLAQPIAVALAAEAPLLAPVTVQAGGYVAADEPDVALSNLDVVTTPGAAADVYRAIQTFPGVQAVDEGAGLFVRGGDVAETRVLLDDAPVLSPYRYESPTGGTFGAFDPFQLDGIFFSSGGFGARYGDALSGVAELRTLDRPPRTSGGLTASLAAVSAGAALALPHRLGVRGTLTRSFTGLLFAINGTTREFTHAPEGRDASGAVTWSYGSDGAVKVFAVDQWSRFGVALDFPSYSGSFDADERHSLAVASWHDRLGAVRPSVSLGTARSERTQRFGALDLTTLERFATLTARAEVRLAPRLTLTAGGDVEHRTSAYEGSVPDQGYDISPGARRKVIESEIGGTRHAAFAEGDWLPVNRLRITAGLRSDRSSLTRRRTADPRLAAAFRLSDAATLTAAWGVYHQVPSPFLFEPTVGDTALGPMRATHAVLGAQLEGRSVLLRVEAYRKTYRDLAQQTRDRDVASGGRGSAAGADVFLRWRGSPLVDGRIAYSFIRARRTDPDTRALARSPFDVTHTLSVVAERRWGARFTISGAWRYSTGRPYTPVAGAAFDADEGVWVPVYGAPYGERLPAFQRVDLSASLLHSFGGRNLTVFFVGVQNALDRANVYGYRYSADYSSKIAERSQFKRSVYVGASVYF